MCIEDMPGLEDPELETLLVLKDNVEALIQERRRRARKQRDGLFSYSPRSNELYVLHRIKGVDYIKLSDLQKKGIL